MDANAIVWLINTAICLICIGIILKKYQEKHSATAIYLTVLFITIAGANLASAFDHIYRGTLYIPHFGYAFALIFLAIGTIALQYFTINVFLGEMKDVSPKLRYTAFLFSIVVLFICSWGSVLLFTEQTNTMIILAIELLLAVALFLAIAIKALQLAKRSYAGFFRKAVIFIALFAISMIFMFLCYVLDGTYAYLGSSIEGESVWSFIGSCTFTIAIILAYCGFVYPMRFVGDIEQE